MDDEDNIPTKVFILFQEYVNIWNIIEELQYSGPNCKIELYLLERQYYEELRKSRIKIIECGYRIRIIERPELYIIPIKNGEIAKQNMHRVNIGINLWFVDLEQNQLL